jgi:hypothetical protein
MRAISPESDDDREEREQATLLEVTGFQTHTTTAGVRQATAPIVVKV